MEVFEGVDFVRLRSMQHGGAYVHAAKDGRSVRLHRTGLSWSYNAVWAVQRRISASGTLYVLLRGAYGRYLGAPDASTRGSLCPFPPPCRVAALPSGVSSLRPKLLLLSVAPNRLFAAVAPVFGRA